MGRAVSVRASSDARRRLMHARRLPFRVASTRRLGAVSWPALLLLFQLLSCGPSTLRLRFYSGPPRAERQVAHLSMRLPAGHCHFVLLDRQRLADCEYEWLDVDLAPGNHQLDIINPLVPRRPPFAVTFSVIAGHSYRVFQPLNDAYGMLAPIVYESDPSSERSLGPVSSPGFVDEDAARRLR